VVVELTAEGDRAVLSVIDDDPGSPDGDLRYQQPRPAPIPATAVRPPRPQPQEAMTRSNASIPADELLRTVSAVGLQGA
jgi:hypothetical protein